MTQRAEEPVHLLEHPATTIEQNPELVGILVAPAVPMPLLDGVFDDIFEWGSLYDECALPTRHRLPVREHRRGQVVLRSKGIGSVIGHRILCTQCSSRNP